MNESLADDVSNLDAELFTLRHEVEELETENELLRQEMREVTDRLNAIESCLGAYEVHVVKSDLDSVLANPEQYELKMRCELAVDYANRFLDESLEAIAKKFMLGSVKTWGRRLDQWQRDQRSEGRNRGSNGC